MEKIYALYRESQGFSPSRALAEYRRIEKTPGFLKFMAEEAERQGKGQRRHIGGDVYNACMQMFMKKPKKGNVFRTLWKVAYVRALKSGLSDPLDVRSLTASDIRRVANILDDLFAEGTLLRYIGSKGPILRFKIEEEVDPANRNGAMYSDSSNNTIALIRPVWKRPMPNPCFMDGFPVKTKLEWLCHMTAHELCHALANVACGEACAKKARNHGKVFKRLNHSIFGHPGSER